MLDTNLKSKISKKTIKRDIEILKQEGKIKRIGPKTGGRGYWEVRKEDG